MRHTSIVVKKIIVLNSKIEKYLFLYKIVFFQTFVTVKQPQEIFSGKNENQTISHGMQRYY